MIDPEKHMALAMTRFGMAIGVAIGGWIGSEMGVLPALVAAVGLFVLSFVVFTWQVWHEND